MSTCPFCNDYGAKTNIIWENKDHFLRWDAYPVSEGHLLVIPKRHIRSFVELSESEGPLLFDAIKNGVEIVRKKYAHDGVNIGINDGEAAGQTVPHLHVHIIPRRKGDVQDPRGGIRGVIPGKRGY